MDYLANLASSPERWAPLAGLGLLVLILLLVRDPLRRAYLQPGLEATAFRTWLRERLAEPYGVILLVVILTGIALRITYALTVPIVYDESVTYWLYASRGIWHSWWSYVHPNNHVLHSILVRLSTLLFGDGVVALRVPSLVAGTLASLTIALFALRYLGSIQAVVLTAFVAFHPVLIEFGALARGYSLALFLTASLVLVATRLLEKPTAPLWWSVPLIGALGMWAVPTMAIPLAGLGLWVIGRLVASGRDDQTWEQTEKWGFGAVTMVWLTVLLYSPVISATGYDRLLGNAWIAPLTLRRWLGGLGPHLVDIVQSFGGSSLELGIALAVAAALGLRIGTAGARPVSWIASAMIVGAVVLAAAQRVLPPVRTLTPIFPFLFLPVAVAVARGLGTFSSRRPRRIAVAVLAITFAVPPWFVALEPEPDTSKIVGGLPPLVEYLRDETGLSAEDRIVAEYPVRGLLGYYLAREEMNLARSVLERAGYEAGVTWLVTPTDTIPPPDSDATLTPSALLDSRGLMGAVNPVYRNAQVTLYRIDEVLRVRR